MNDIYEIVRDFIYVENIVPDLDIRSLMALYYVAGYRDIFVLDDNDNVQSPIIEEIRAVIRDGASGDSYRFANYIQEIMKEIGIPGYSNMQEHIDRLFPEEGNSDLSVPKIIKRIKQELKRDYGNMPATKIVVSADYDYYPEEDAFEASSGIATLYYSHRRYQFAGKKIDELLHPREYNDWNEVYDALVKEGEIDPKMAWVPVYMYDHSGLAFSTGSFSCHWDSGQLGILVAKEESVTMERLEEIVGLMDFQQTCPAYHIEVYSGDVLIDGYAVFPAKLYPNDIREYIESEYIKDTSFEDKEEGNELIYTLKNSIY